GPVGQSPSASHCRKNPLGAPPVCKYDGRYASGEITAAANKNGIPSRTARSRTNPRAPLRASERHTNKPEIRNISDMKNVSLNAASRWAPDQRAGSTTGNARHHGCSTRLCGGGGANG